MSKRKLELEIPVHFGTITLKVEIKDSKDLNGFPQMVESFEQIIERSVISREQHLKMQSLVDKYKTEIIEAGVGNENKKVRKPMTDEQRTLKIGVCENILVKSWTGDPWCLTPSEWIIVKEATKPY